jgi:hypothetical protein
MSSPHVVSTSWTRESVPYTRCFCEENAYRLLSLLAEDTATEHDADAACAVFVSNADKTVKFHLGDGKHTMWDYHVVVLVNGQIFDHDATHVSFPCAHDEWLRQSFRVDDDAVELHPRFRVVPWPLLKRHFRSDRSHMFPHRQALRDAGLSFPAEPEIRNSRGEAGSNLFDEFVDHMDGADADAAGAGIGTLVSYDELLKDAHVAGHARARRRT